MFQIPQIKEITNETKNGLYLIDHEAYHSSEGLSSTTVKKALGSYNEFIYEKEDNDAFAFGRAFHSALLEPELFEKEYIRSPEFPYHKNSNAYKDAFSKFVEEAQGKTIIGVDDAEKIEAMIQSVTGHAEWPNFKFQAEVAAVSRCKDTNLLLKCKADMFGTKVVDVKTTSTGVKPHEFMSDVIRFGYHISAAFYHDIIESVVGFSPEFYLLPVSKNKPHDCELYKLSDSLLDEGRKLYRAAIKRIYDWAVMTPVDRKKSGQKIKLLEATPRVLYNTTDILKYIER